MKDSPFREECPIRGHGSKYDRKKEAAIAALLAARTEQEAALEAGVSRRTLSRWKNLPEFRAELHARKQELLNSVNTRYLSAGSAAVSTVLKMMVDPNAPPSVRLRAASQVQTAAEKSVEKEARAMQAAQVQREKRDTELEERSSSAQREILDLMGEDGIRYVALVRLVYAEGELTRDDWSELVRCNIRFVSIWRRLDIPLSYLRAETVNLRIRNRSKKRDA
jgi:hypothetical protein